MTYLAVRDLHSATLKTKMGMSVPDKKQKIGANHCRGITYHGI